MNEHEAIRELLKKHFPDVDVFIQASNDRRIILMWSINGTQLFNFSVNRTKLLVALQGGPFTDCYELFKAAGIPNWNIEYFNEIKLKFSK